MKKYLLVDDSKLQRRIQGGILGKHGVEAEQLSEAKDGQEALVAARAEKFHLIIVDWNMPNKDGVTFVRELRAEGNQTPVLMVTSESQPEKYAAAIEAGANDLLPKPYTEESYWEAVRVYS